MEQQDAVQGGEAATSAATYRAVFSQCCMYQLQRSTAADQVPDSGLLAEMHEARNHPLELSVQLQEEDEFGCWVRRQACSSLQLRHTSRGHTRTQATS